MFDIHCTTCHARLNVHSKESIGQIHACPKCGSMIMVTPPPAGAIEDASSGAPSTPSSRFPTANRAVVPATDAPSPESAEQTFESAARMLEDSPTADEPVDQTMEETSPGEPIDEIDSQAAAGDVTQHTRASQTNESAEVLLPDSRWDSSAERMWRQWSVYGLAAATGFVLAVGTCGLVVFMMADNDQTAEEKRPVGQLADSNQHDEPPFVEQPAPPNSTREDSPDEPNTAEAESSAGGDGDEPPAKADEVLVQVESTTKPAPDVSADADHQTSSAPTASPAETVGEATPPDNGAAEPEELTGTPPRRRRQQVNLDTRLADPIAAVEFQDITMLEFLRFVSDFSTIPITMDVEGLRRAGKGPDSLVSVHRVDTTVSELLVEVLSSHNLVYQLEDDQMIVTKDSRGDDELRQVSFPIKDLVGGNPAGQKTLARLMHDMVAPSSWEESGGQGTLHPEAEVFVISQREPELYEIIYLCEKLRIARGKSPKSRLDPSLFQLATRHARAETKFATPVRLNFIEPTRLVRILDQMGKASGTYLLVDWRSLALMGWTPDAKATLSANDIPLVEALDRLLMSMDLTYRVVSESTIQITSIPSLDSQYEVEFHPVSKLVDAGTSAAELLDQIRAKLGDELFDQDGGALHLDLPSKYLIARLSQPQQVRLAKLLVDWPKP